jgi:hypothetical protein
MEKQKKFIINSKILHNNKYDYSLVDYVNAKQKVKIICPEHGIFEVCPDNHLRLKSSCPKCNGGIKYTKNDFITKCNKIHNMKYDYSLVDYVNAKQKVKIICPEHGIFEQKPSEHINGCECQKCGKIKIINKKTDTTSIFIMKSKKIHGEQYDYSLIDYLNSKEKVKIICSKHGIFEQRPNQHIYGGGCPFCKNSKGEEKIKIYLEKNNIKYVPQKKFDDCRYKRKLPFDFYLHDFNLCVEFDGQQHYIKNNLWGTYYEELKIKDNIKNQYCNGGNGRPKLLRIPYWEIKKIETILDNYLNKKNPSE